MSDLIPPTTTPRTAAFWAGLDRGEVIVEACANCGTRFLPVQPCCPGCGGFDSVQVVIPGTGRVHASTVVRWPAHPAFADLVPYVVALVDLDAGPRVVGRVLDATERPIAGAAVAPVYLTVGAETGLLAFRQV